MTRHETHVVSGHHNGSDCPFVVAADQGRYGMLVDTLLQAAEPDYPQVHDSTWFYVTDQPIWDDGSDTWPSRWMRVGFHDGFGGALFGDMAEVNGQDWAWVALASEPMDDAPVVYFDQSAGTAFPPQAVMPVDQLRAVVLEWVRTGRRPSSVRWLPINSLVWRLTEDGQVDVPIRSS